MTSSIATSHQLGSDCRRSLKRVKRIFPAAPFTITFVHQPRLCIYCCLEGKTTAPSKQPRSGLYSNMHLRMCGIVKTPRRRSFFKEKFFDVEYTYVQQHVVVGHRDGLPAVKMFHLISPLIGPHACGLQHSYSSHRSSRGGGGELCWKVVTTPCLSDFVFYRLRLWALEFISNLRMLRQYPT